MKKLSIISSFSLFLGIVLVIVINSFSRTPSETEQPAYILNGYVIGSGGVMGASNSNYFHFATAGEEIVGFMQNTNHFLLSGYWQTDVFIWTGVEQIENVTMPEAFRLHQNYPNPFNPQTTIEYDLPDESEVNVEIYNLVGQRVRLLLHSQIQGPGFKRIVWDGHDDQGALLGTGVYLYRLIVSKASPENKILFQQTRKMLFIK